MVTEERVATLLSRPDVEADVCLNGSILRAAYGAVTHTSVLQSLSQSMKTLCEKHAPPGTVISRLVPESSVGTRKWSW